MTYPGNPGYDPSVYRTKFIALAILLKHLGYEMISYEQPKPGGFGKFQDRMTFVFANTPELMEVVDSYFNLHRELSDLIYGRGATDYEHVLVEDFFARTKQEEKEGLRANGFLIGNLKDSGINTIGQLMRRKYSDIALIKGIGPSGLALMQERLGKKGLYLSR